MPLPLGDCCAGPLGSQFGLLLAKSPNTDHLATTAPPNNDAPPARLCLGERHIQNMADDLVRSAQATIDNHEQSADPLPPVCHQSADVPRQSIRSYAAYAVFIGVFGSFLLLIIFC